MDVQLGFRMLLPEHVPGHDGGLIGAGALAVQTDVDEIRVALLGNLPVQLQILRGVNLRGYGKHLGLVQNLVEFLRGDVHAVPVFLTVSQNGQRQDADIQLLPEGSGDIRGGIR